jgi:hypothetical protein
VIERRLPANHANKRELKENIAGRLIFFIRVIRVIRGLFPPFFLYSFVSLRYSPKSSAFPVAHKINQYALPVRISAFGLLSEFELRISDFSRYSRLFA